jgi:hypothetical protein
MRRLNVRTDISASESDLALELGIASDNKLHDSVYISKLPSGDLAGFIVQTQFDVDSLNQLNPNSLSNTDHLLLPAPNSFGLGKDSNEKFYGGFYNLWAPSIDPILKLTQNPPTRERPTTTTTPEEKLKRKGFCLYLPYSMLYIICKLTTDDVVI